MELLVTDTARGTEDFRLVGCTVEVAPLQEVGFLFMLGAQGYLGGLGAGKERRMCSSPKDEHPIRRLCTLCSLCTARARASKACLKLSKS